MVMESIELPRLTRPRKSLSGTVSRPETPWSPVIKSGAERQNYSCEELLQFIRFFPSHFTLGLQGSALKIRHLQDEVLLSLHSLPQIFRIPQYNLLGYIFATQGNYNYAFRYFHEVIAIEENNVVSIANQAHCYLRQDLPDKTHDCLRKLINLTSSADFIQITKESWYMSDAKTDLGYAYHVFGLNNAAKRMYESALQYNGGNLCASIGMAETLLTISLHDNRSRKDFHLKAAQKLIAQVLASEPAFLAATIMQLRVKAERKALTINQINSYIALIIKENESAMNAKIYRDLAEIKIARKDFDKELGARALLERSVGLSPTAAAHHLLGKIHYFMWHKERKRRKKGVKKSLSVSFAIKDSDLPEITEVEEEGGGAIDGGTQIPEPLTEEVVKKPQLESDMLKMVRVQYEAAAKKCYNSNLEILLDLGIVLGKLADTSRAAEYLKKAVTSDDTSIQERGYRYLAIFEARAPEKYLREALSRQHFVKLSEAESEEFWERVFGHAEEALEARGCSQAGEWIRALVEVGHPRADVLVELYNKDSNTPMRGLNGEVPAGASKKALARERKQSKSRIGNGVTS